MSDILIVLTTFGDPGHIDDGSKWDAGKTKVPYCPAKERDELLADMRELLNDIEPSGDSSFNGMPASVSWGLIDEMRKKWGVK